MALTQGLLLFCLCASRTLPHPAPPHRKPRPLHHRVALATPPPTWGEDLPPEPNPDLRLKAKGPEPAPREAGLHGGFRF